MYCSMTFLHVWVIFLFKSFLVLFCTIFISKKEKLGFPHLGWFMNSILDIQLRSLWGYVVGLWIVSWISGSGPSWDMWFVYEYYLGYPAPVPLGICGWFMNIILDIRLRSLWRYVVGLWILSWISGFGPSGDMWLDYE